MCCGGDAPSPDPLIGQAAKMNAELAKKAYDWYTRAYETDFKPRQQRQDELTERLVGDYLDTQQQNKSMAREQLERQRALFFPAEEQMVRDAMGYDSQERMDLMAGRAAADVNQQFSNARGQQDRSMARYGLRPDSGAFAAANTRLTLGQALGAAGASNQARNEVQDRAIALRSGVANFGRGLGNQAASGFSTSIAANQGAGSQMNSSLASAQAGYGIMGQGFNTAIGANSSAASIAQADYNARMNAYQAEQSQMGSLIGLGVTAGIGGIAGGWAGAGNALAGRKIFADGGQARGGGRVRGPGGPVDDKIPAMLSDGEYVIPADVVKAKGVEFFDKLKAKYHTPAAVQRRRAIERG